MYVVFDEVAGTMIGPFNDEEAAVMWQLHSADMLNDPDQVLSIYQVTEPVEWMLDNFANPVLEEML